MTIITRRLAELRRMLRRGEIRDLHHADYITEQHGAVFVYQKREGDGWAARLTLEGRA